MTIWFTADQHYGHANAIKHCNRPFSDVEAMNEALIANHNALVKPGDSVYMLGDVTFKIGIERAASIISRLNGVKYLIRGNHDWNTVRAHERYGLFSWVEDLHLCSPNGQPIVLCHYAMRVWAGSHRGSWHLYGHSHGKLPGNGMSFDVGVDCNYYKPISFDEVAAIMQQRKREESL